MAVRSCETEGQERSKRGNKEKDTKWDRDKKRKIPARNIQNMFQIFLFLSSAMKLSVNGVKEVNEEEQNMLPQSLRQSKK